MVDTDQIARELVKPGQPALREIVGQFGVAILDGGGALRRGALAERVFGDAQARQRLEHILHPRIRSAWKQQLSAWADAGCARAVVVIPLLFEVRAEAEFDLTVCLACATKTQWLRLRARGWEDSAIQQRLDSQWPLRDKMEHADRVIWNEASLEILAAQVERVFGPL